MFTEIYKLIDERKFDDAVAALAHLYRDADEKNAAYAGYLLGYINTRYDYKQKNTSQARRYLRENIHGNHPHPYAYVLYSRVEEDNNIALNHLNKGLELFPKDARILEELLAKSPDKGAVITLIKDSGLNNPNLMGRVIECLIREKRWGSISRFLFRIEKADNLDEQEQLYLDLIRAYTYILQDDPKYGMAEEIFEKLTATDTDNYLEYSHYLGLIYSLIKQGDMARATSYFDRLPVNNSLTDFDDGPWPFGIYIDFEEIYKLIFETVVDAFERDDIRKLKARVLYALYLYHPSEMCAVCRYKKADAVTLTRYLKAEFNPKVAAALYNMRCHFKQYKEAYEVFWRFIEERHDLVDNWVFFSDVLESADEARLEMLTEESIKHLQDDNYDEKAFVDVVLGELLKKLHEHEMYSCVRRIAEFFSNEDIIACGGTFICAYAFGEEDNDRATILYEKLVEREPNNAAAINNLGVRYRENGEFFKALMCYEKASRIDPKKELYKNNLRSIQKSIQEDARKEIEATSDNISIETFREIGYTVDLCKRIFSVQDIDLRDVIQRDLRECAIAVVAGQDKLATIMCGSIVEALLLYRIKETGITAYNVSAVSHRKNAANCPVSDMVLNELLHVALVEKILDKADHHLGHYLKDYRNMVHPAKEIRMKENITHENVATMWSVLVRLINDLFP